MQSDSLYKSFYNTFIFNWYNYYVITKTTWIQMRLIAYYSSIQRIKEAKNNNNNFIKYIYI